MAGAPDLSSFPKARHRNETEVIVRFDAMCPVHGVSLEDGLLMLVGQTGSADAQLDMLRMPRACSLCLHGNAPRVRPLRARIVGLDPSWMPREPGKETKLIDLRIRLAVTEQPDEEQFRALVDRMRGDEDVTLTLD